MNNYYIIIIINAFFSALSQILLNISADKKHKNKLLECLNPYVIISYGILFLVLIINVYCMRFVLLKNAHAVAASTYIFVLLLSRVFLKEKITAKKIIGNIIIILGIFLDAKADSKIETI